MSKTPKTEYRNRYTPASQPGTDLTMNGRSVSNAAAVQPMSAIVPSFPPNPLNTDLEMRNTAAEIEDANRTCQWLGRRFSETIPTNAPQ